MTFAFNMSKEAQDSKRNRQQINTLGKFRVATIIAALNFIIVNNQICLKVHKPIVQGVFHEIFKPV